MGAVQRYIVTNRRKLPETQAFPSAFSYLDILLKETETEYANLQ